MSKEKILDEGEKMNNKEALLEEYAKLKREVDEAQQELNEQQKDFKGDMDMPTADFFASRALIEHKIKRMKEIEIKLQPEKEA